MTGNLSAKNPEKLVVMFGSCARGEESQCSDCDILFVNTKPYQLPRYENLVLNSVEYTWENFKSLHSKGSLFIRHILTEGKLIEGDSSSWERFKNEFSVQKNFLKEIEEIYLSSRLFLKPEIFGGQFLAPLTSSFTALKNTCIFYLANKNIYEFSKERCISMAVPNKNIASELIQLKSVYDYSERRQDICLTIDLKDSNRCIALLRKVSLEIERMHDESL